MDPGFQIPKDSPFGLANVPFGVMSKDGKAFCATRFGDHAVDLADAQAKGLFEGPLWTKPVFQGGLLNEFMGLGKEHWRWVRTRLQHLAEHERGKLRALPLAGLKAELPCTIGDYTDFYSSRAHAFNVGSIIRGPANALQDNWLHLPVGYHGRSSSIVPTGVDLRRPRGQTKAPDAKVPSFTACKRLDFEIEVGAFLGGKLNELGHPIRVDEAPDFIFGLVILNDWSARDLQTWEYVPLGPFTAKNLMSSISPWIVTSLALQPFKIELSKQDPAPLPYLQEKQHVSYDMQLQLSVNGSPLVQTNFKHLYWSVAQQLAHHAISGCNMRPGDLLGSGTISGEDKGAWGSLLELTWGGKEKVGGTRTWLEDGDEVTIAGLCEKEGLKVGFGQVTAKVLPALEEAAYIS